jgi:hypothetical protein
MVGIKVKCNHNSRFCSALNIRIPDGISGEFIYQFFNLTGTASESIF